MEMMVVLRTILREFTLCRRTQLTRCVRAAVWCSHLRVTEGSECGAGDSRGSDVMGIDDNPLATFREPFARTQVWS